LQEAERRELWEVFDRSLSNPLHYPYIAVAGFALARADQRSTIADGILDRLVHNAHRIEMRGESMRNKLNPPPEERRE